MYMNQHVCIQNMFFYVFVGGPIPARSPEDPGDGSGPRPGPGPLAGPDPCRVPPGPRGGLRGGAKKRSVRIESERALKGMGPRRS